MPFNNEFGVYEAQEFLVQFGESTLVGFGEGAAVSIVYDADWYNMTVGVDGISARGKSSNRGALVTVTLLQTAQINATLSALMNLDQLTPGGAGIRPLLLKDQTGLSIYAAEAAWLQKPADADFADVINNREWPFRTPNLSFLHGGNNAPAPVALP